MHDEEKVIHIIMKNRTKIHFAKGITTAARSAGEKGRDSRRIGVLDLP